MRILHCGDLHLDSRMTANLSEDKARERNIEILGTFKEMIRYASDNKVTAIIIAGDLFDTISPSNTFRNVVLSEIANCPDILFFYLKGNHDYKDVFECCPNNLMLFSDNYRSYKLDNVVITGIELNKVNCNIAAESLELDENDFNIVVMHGQDTEYEIKEDTESICLRDFRYKNIDYMALGHIHSYRVQRLDERGIYCYCGCLEGRGFDETGEHGFVVIDIDSTRRFEYEFVPFAKRKLYNIEVDISLCMNDSDIIKEIANTSRYNGVTELDMVSFKLVGNISDKCDYDLLYITESIKSDYYFCKLQDMSTIRTEYLDYRYDETFKGEFIRLVMASSESQQDKEKIIQLGISLLA